MQFDGVPIIAAHRGQVYEKANSLSFTLNPGPRKSKPKIHPAQGAEFSVEKRLIADRLLLISGRGPSQSSNSLGVAL